MLRDVKEAIRAETTQFVRRYPRTHGTRTRWKDPLIGYASASDPLFGSLKDLVGPCHALPRDVLQGAVTVIAFFVPFTEETTKTNVTGEEASREWAQAYIDTNRLLADVSSRIAACIKARGHAVHPMPVTHSFDRRTLISTWSHRHVAYIAGLGTLGLNNMLITRNGCCGRLGSLITSLKIEPDSRPTTEACLYRSTGACTQCIDRCLWQALSLEGFDRHRCYEICLLNEKRFMDMGKADVCGKCLVGIPCAHRIPPQAASGQHSDKRIRPQSAASLRK